MSDKPTVSTTLHPPADPGISHPQLVCAISVRDSVTFLASKVDNLAAVLNTMMRLPLSIGIIAVASVFFWQKLIIEQTWLALMLVALFPFYGDAVRSLLAAFTRLKGVPGKGIERAAQTLSAALLFLASAWAAWSGIVSVAIAQAHRALLVGISLALLGLSGCAWAKIEVLDPATGGVIARGDVRRCAVDVTGQTIERTPGGTVRWRIERSDGSASVERAVEAGVKAALSSGS